MSTKIALLSDIHGNTPALQAVLDDIQRQGCRQAFVLGDIINGFDPHGCVELLRQWSAEAGIPLDCIKGNAELYTLTPDLDALPERDSPMNVALTQLIRWFQAHLSEADLEWMRSLPDFILQHGTCLVHDSPIDRLSPQSWQRPDIEPKYQEWFYHAHGIWPNRPEAEWRKLLSFMEARHLTRVFCGHTHTPFCREFGDRLICNVGSVGAPLDSDYRPSWVLLEETSAGKPEISIRRVDYDVALIHQLIDDTPDYPDFQTPGFRDAYKKWLATGIHWRAFLPKGPQEGHEG